MECACTQDSISVACTMEATTEALTQQFEVSAVPIAPAKRDKGLLPSWVHKLTQQIWELLGDLFDVSAPCAPCADSYHITQTLAFADTAGVCSVVQVACLRRAARAGCGLAVQALRDSAGLF